MEAELWTQPIERALAPFTAWVAPLGLAVCLVAWREVLRLRQSIWRPCAVAVAHCAVVDDGERLR